MRLSLIVSAVSALQFNLHVLDDERCFMEELPRDMQQLWHYVVEHYDVETEQYKLTPPAFGLRIHVKRVAYGLEQGADTTVLSKVYGNEGRMTFTAAENGKHLICFKAEGKNAAMFDMFRLTLHKRRGRDFTYYKTARSSDEEELTQLGLRMQKTMDQWQQISVVYTFIIGN